MKKQVVWTGPKKAFMDHGGVLSTGSGLVMQGGLDGNLRIFDDANGTLLREIMIGSAMIAAPMTYSVNGMQYVAILAGSGGGGWSSVDAGKHCLTQRQCQSHRRASPGGGAVPQPAPLPPLPPMSEPPARTGTKADIEAGRKLFAENCAHCHTNGGRGPAPDLRRSTSATHAAFQQIVRDGALQPRGMPRWDDLLSSSDVDQIHAYVIDLARQLYGSEKH